MPDLFIKDAEVAQLVGFVNNIPTQFGRTILNFLDDVLIERQKEARELEEKEKESFNGPKDGPLDNVPDPNLQKESGREILATLDTGQN